MTSQAVTVEMDGRVARLRLDSPHTGNAFDPELARALRAATTRIAESADVGVVVLTAAGAHFCVGGDLRYMDAQGEQLEAALFALASDVHVAIEALASIDAPVVAVVEGTAAGAGFGLVCACDLVVAGPSARFLTAYTAVGLSPDAGVSWTLPRIVGTRRAAELLLTNRALDAKTAFELGIVTHLAEQGTLEETVEGLVESLAAGSTNAYGVVKDLLLGASRRTLHDQLGLEARQISRLAASSEGRRRIEAFVRRPKRAAGDRTS